MTKQSDAAKQQERNRPVICRAAMQEAFERAYQAWLDELCDRSIDGMPVAESTGDSIFQAFLREWRMAEVE